MTGPATAIIRNICNKRRNSDLRADDRDINAALNERMSVLEDALRAAEPLLRGELEVMVNSFEPNPTLEEQAEIDALRGGVEKARKTLGIEFACQVCGAGCDTAPQLPALPVCPEHCEDHEYEYVRGERGHFCKHCNQPRPEDW